MCYKYWSVVKSLPDETTRDHLIRGDRMTDFEEKVYKYLASHKKPVQAKTLAKMWIVSDAKVARTLADLEKMGIAKVDKVGSSKFYRLNPSVE
jgi:Fic family protein